METRRTHTRSTSSFVTAIAMSAACVLVTSLSSSVRAFGVSSLSRQGRTVSIAAFQYKPLGNSFQRRSSFSSKSYLVSSFRQSSDDDASPEKSRVPITLLSGFLGSGKTSALTHLLENRAGIKVGVIVNDVASVNIDAKLIANPSLMGGDASAMLESGGTIELQNGCACCSLADELLISVQSLLDKRSFDAVVVELSGVADPVAVRQNWADASLVSIRFEKICVSRHNI